MSDMFQLSYLPFPRPDGDESTPDLRLCMLTCLAAALLATAGSCTWMQPPDPKKAVRTPTEAHGPGGDETHGELYPVRSGLWAYVLETPGRLSTLDAGELLVHRGQDRRGRPTAHLFAVVADRNWGLMLQRLDNSPPASHFRPGQFVPAQVRAPSVSNVPGVCVGQGPPQLGHPCLSEAERGRRWFVYRIEDDGRLPVAEDPKESAALPIRRIGLAHRNLHDGELTVLGDRLDDGRWLAIPTDRRWRDPPDVGIGFGGGCGDLKAGLSGRDVETIDLETSRVPSHPLAIEGMGFETGADLLVTCEAKTATVALPTLFRNPLSAYGATRFGPPLLGRRTHSFSTDVLTADVLVGLASVAAGDVLVGEYELLGWLRDTEFAATSGSQLATGTGQLAAAAGRPEAALRLGRTATRGDWHPGANAEWQLLRAASHAAFDRKSQYLAGLKAARETASGAGRDDLEAWLKWARLQVQLERQSRPPAAKFEKLADEAADAGQPAWAAAYHIARAIHRPSIDDEHADRVMDAGRRHGAELLAQSALGDVEPLACPDSGPCRLDIYGRRLPALADRHAPSDSNTASKSTSKVWIERLSTAGTADFRPGLVSFAGKWNASTPAPDLEITSLLAASLTTVGGGTSVTLSIAEPMAQMIRDGTCPTDGLHPGVLESVAIAADGQSSEPALLRAQHWLLSNWLPTACESPARAAERLRSRAEESRRLAMMGAELLPALVASAEAPETRRRTIEAAGQFAVDHRSMAEFCKRWHLAVALAEANRGHPKKADRALAASVNCPTADGLEETQSIVAAYVAFERTGQLPRRVNHRVAARLNPRLGRPLPEKGPFDRADSGCVGLAPFEYRIHDVIDPSVAGLAENLAVGETSARDTLTLQTTSDRLAAATDVLERGKQRLKAGQLQEARRAFEQARTDFRAIDFEPGVSQSTFLLDTLFPDVTAAEVDDGSEGGADSAECPQLEKLPDTAGGLRCLFERSDDVMSRLENEFEPPKAAGHASAERARSFLAVSLVFESPSETRRRVAELPDDASTGLCLPEDDDASGAHSTIDSTVTSGPSGESNK